MEILATLKHNHRNKYSYRKGEYVVVKYIQVKSNDLEDTKVYLNNGDFIRLSDVNRIYDGHDKLYPGIIGSHIENLKITMKNLGLAQTVKIEF